MWAIWRKAPKGLARPARNGRRFSAASVSGTAHQPNATLANAIAAVAKNGVRGPNSPRKPPTTGPRMNPTPKAAPMSPKFWARFSGGNRSATHALAIAKLVADMPATSRPT